jgi:DNA-binding NarL/FixJ family response regulator
VIVATAPVGIRHITRPASRLCEPRERELARLVAQGLDNAQIAATLGVANKTVRNALSVLYRKLGVDSRARAVARARDMGF